MLFTFSMYLNLAASSQQNNQSKKEVKHLRVCNRTLHWMRAYVHPLPLLLVLCCTIALLLFPEQKAGVQVALFPCVLVAFYFLPKHHQQRVPKLSIWCCLSLWGLALLHNNGYIFIPSSQPTLYMSHLQNDSHGISRHEFYVGYNKISRLYDLPSMRLLQRSIQSEEEAQKWLNSYENAVMLIHGTSSWLTIVLRSDYPFSKTLGSSSDLLSPAIFPVSLSKDSPLPMRLLIGTSIPSFTIHTADPYLARNFLGLLSKGLFEVPSENDREKENHLIASSDELRRTYFQLAAGVQGPWKSSTPQAVALFFLGVDYFIDANKNNTFDRSEINCALEAFQRTTKRLRRHYNPELYSLALNNAAVSEVLIGIKDADFSQAKRWLLAAASVSKDSGEATEGAKIALMNLLTLEKTGVF